ncbi:MAG TPA: TetR/AcrR family transcriptional regulator [Candidatus Dormibacteraeota bacterium]
MAPQTSHGTVERLSAEERREQILQAAITVFAEDGYAAASTEEIARRAGISQPYLFRLYGTKRELVLAAIQRCFEDTEATFERAVRESGAPGGEDALHAMGQAYMQLIQHDHVRLRSQLQAYAACDDPEIRALVSRNFGHLVDVVRRLSGVDSAALAKFVANGMLLNVLAMLGQFSEPQAWAVRLMEGCFEELEPGDALSHLLGRA